MTTTQSPQATSFNKKWSRTIHVYCNNNKMNNLLCQSQAPTQGLNLITPEYKYNIRIKVHQKTSIKIRIPAEYRTKEIQIFKKNIKMFNKIVLEI